MTRLLAALGGLIIALGVLLPWAKLINLQLSLTAILTGLNDLGWAVAPAGLAIPVLLLAPGLRRLNVRVVAPVVIAIAIGCGLVALNRILAPGWARAQVTNARFVDALGSPITLTPDLMKYVQAEAGYGLFVILAGAALAVVGGVQMLRHPDEAAAAWDVGRSREALYFATRSKKVFISLAILLALVALALVGPMMRPGEPNTTTPFSREAPSGVHWFGTTETGQDVYMQYVHGLGATLLVGLLGGSLAALIGMTVGFVAGYMGGIVDEILNILTNVVLVIPTLALLLIAAAYLNARGLMIEAVFIGLTSWPWAARAIRAQTFSLKARDFVDLARLSGVSGRRIIVTEIAPNMASYLFMTFILMFGGAILIASTLEFIGLGPTTGQSLGLMMQYAAQGGAMQLGEWWWFVPPGLTITAIVGSLYVMNVGLDEIFNPKLRQT
jgi:peptide/nickel transport system permease protein